MSIKSTAKIVRESPAPGIHQSADPRSRQQCAQSRGFHFPYSRQFRRSERRSASLIDMWPLILLVYVNLLLIGPTENIEVVAALYDTVTLRCSFPFIQGPHDLAVVWEKNGGGRFIVHKYMNGRDHLEDQDRNYTGRTELSKDFSQGVVELTLRDVTYSDEGTYYCRAVNGRSYGEQKLAITIHKLNAEDPMVTATHIDGKRRLKCIDIGVFRIPKVKWYNNQSTDLSGHGTLNITVLGDGRKKVESILDLDVETNTHYFCQVKEGRLKMTARAVISDGNPVTVTETKLPE